MRIEYLSVNSKARAKLLQTAMGNPAAELVARVAMAVSFLSNTVILCGVVTFVVHILALAGPAFALIIVPASIGAFAGCGLISFIIGVKISKMKAGHGEDMGEDLDRLYQAIQLVIFVPGRPTPPTTLGPAATLPRSPAPCPPRSPAPCRHAVGRIAATTHACGCACQAASSWRAG